MSDMKPIEPGCLAIVKQPCATAKETIERYGYRYTEKAYGQSVTVYERDHEAPFLCAHTHWWVTDERSCPECGLLRIDGGREEYDINEDAMRMVDA